MSSFAGYHLATTTHHAIFNQIAFSKHGKYQQVFSSIPWASSTLVDSWNPKFNSKSNLFHAQFCSRNSISFSPSHSDNATTIKTSSQSDKVIGVTTLYTCFFFLFSQTHYNRGRVTGLIFLCSSGR